MYQVTLRTLPNNALYEATVSHNPVDTASKYYRVSSDHISRINRYASQPDCIAGQLPHLRAYCYCSRQISYWQRSMRYCLAHRLWTRIVQSLNFEKTSKFVRTFKVLITTDVQNRILANLKMWWNFSEFSIRGLPRSFIFTRVGTSAVVNATFNFHTMQKDTT